CPQWTNDGLAALKVFTGLEQLDVRDSDQVTDAGLVHLGRLSGLKNLGIQRCKQITNAGLLHLKTLSRLKHLGIYDGCPKVTEAGVAALKAYLPDCSISLYRDDSEAIAPAASEPVAETNVWQISVRGVWAARPANNPRVVYTKVTDTPAEVT